MFLPDNMKNTTEEANADNLRKKAYANIEKWSMEIIPERIRKGVQISVQEVQCGDPDCAPIDTAIAILFPAGGRGMMGLPLEAHEVTKEILEENFPYGEVLEKWAKGEDAEWPPMEDMMGQLPELRFDVGDKVECRVGADEVTGWAKGEVIQLWYREQGWQDGSFAPYKIRLDDGRDIFAPADVDQVIRAQKK
ncbi:hypothetical protein CTEN210_14375 [Chaetoceros tenuissimus]|uniref:Uncharacterized protein n=1 Tax=Chaetoceros tenuissimus TaxID=426638 RepID=A0AAD3D8E6_9STRA|nr:hypothetical protein CTEN210_14375 [Chaetoceros tenuissimus]